MIGGCILMPSKTSPPQGHHKKYVNVTVTLHPLFSKGRLNDVNKMRNCAKMGKPMHCSLSRSVYIIPMTDG